MKIIIYTISDINNYGNRLQNYALQQKYKQLGLDVDTFWQVNNLKYKTKQCIKFILLAIRGNITEYKINNKRRMKFIDFNNNISFVKGKKFRDYYNRYDLYSIGSDQVWNYNFKKMTRDDFLLFADSNRTIGYAPSFGVQAINNENVALYSKGLSHIKYLSIREEAGKQIIEQMTNRKNIPVIVDPTMLLSAEEWQKVMKKPEQLKSQKYILNYFLGNLSSKRMEKIEKLAKSKGWMIINILDINDPFYVSGPAEFLYLEKNAELICTDSFHSSVFGIIFNTPFVIFDRDDNIEKMNSRIDTLIDRFNLHERKYDGDISLRHLNINFNHANRILETAKMQGDSFLRKSIGL